MKEYFKQIDALRCYAVLGVLLLHLYPAGYFSLDFFRDFYSYVPGVPVFFCISGFLITGILLANYQETSQGHLIKNFYIRRFLRIFPVYYATLFILFIANVENYREWFINDLLYITNIQQGLRGEFEVSAAPHFWSLAVEEQFYLFWPLLLTLSRRRNYHLAVAIFITAVGITTTFITEASFLNNRTVGCLAYLGSGSLLAVLYIIYKPVITRAHFWLNLVLVIFGIYLLLLSFQVIEMKIWKANYLIGLIIMPVVTLKFALGFRNPVLKPLFENPVILYLGKISYGIYIFHFLALYPVVLFNKMVGIDTAAYPMTMFIAKLVVTVVISAVSWEFFEKRIIRLKHRFEYSAPKKTEALSSR